MNPKPTVLPSEACRSVDQSKATPARRQWLGAMAAVPLGGLITGCGGGSDPGTQSIAAADAPTEAGRAKALRASVDPAPLDPSTAAGRTERPAALATQATSTNAATVPADPQRNYFYAPQRPPAMTGWANVGAGEAVLLRLTTGSHNTAIGDQAQWSQSEGRNNVAVGALALASATATFDCTAIGTEALASATSGVGATAVGRLACASLTEALNNTAVGDSAMRSSIDGRANTAMGYRAAEANLRGGDNTSLGALAAARQPGGSHNTAVGAHAMGDVVAEASENVAIGAYALVAGQGSGHVAVGMRAGAELTGGDRNVMVGSLAGGVSGQKRDATNTIVIGHGARSTRDNCIVIGNDDIDSIAIAGVEFTKSELMALLHLVRRVKPMS